MSLKSLLPWSLSVAVIALSTGVHAAPGPNPKDLRGKIENLTAAAPRIGERSEFQQYVTYHYSAGTSFDPAVDRDVDYLTVIGHENSRGEFSPLHLSTVSESWRKTETGWDVTQKIREITLDGRVTNTLSQKLSFGAKNQLTSSKTLPSPGTAEDQAQFEFEIDSWYSRVFNE